MPENAREAGLRELAGRLLFEMRKEDGGYTLMRSTQVSRPVKHEGLTLDEAEEVLNTWKLRGAHGG